MSSDSVKKDIEENSDIAAFSYFLILSWVILYTRKDSPFIQFHAKQASILFVIFVFIWILPSNLSFLNLVTAALAITGLFQANQGKWWKMPIVSHMVEAGISPDTFWRQGVRFGNILRRSFQAESPAKKETKPASKAEIDSSDVSGLKTIVTKQETFINLQMEQIEFLEQELLTEKYLTKSAIKDLSGEYQKSVENLKKEVTSVLPGKFNEHDTKLYSRFEKKDAPVVFVGGYEEDTLAIFVAAAADEADIVFGRFHGFSVNPTDEKAVKKVIKAVSEAVE